MSLYNKYRPLRLSDVIGQDDVVRLFKNAIMQGRIHHAYLFAGPHGVGKTTVARIIARMLNCMNPEKDLSPCGKCAACQATANEMEGIIEIDAAENRGVEQIRDLKKRIRYVPVYKKRLIILDEAHMLTKEAANTLLKTLEEPPTDTIFILVTTDPDKIINTVRSRCQIVPFNKISYDILADHLEAICNQEGIKHEKTALNLISRYAAGGARDAINEMESIFIRFKEVKEEHVKGSLTRDSKKIATNLFKGGYESLINLSLQIEKEDRDYLKLFEEVIQILFIFLQQANDNVRGVVTETIAIMIEHKNKIGYNTKDSDIFKLAVLVAKNNIDKKQREDAEKS